ncbi:twin-arginine translocation signal domain-containing protein [Streptomyces sp. NPDC019937]|uniref:twin-arginine translocation signal domain-containing protein n=1 Tax=Streptomyces sp. NPDC019937 TaxID=3154787 RepID=UPI0033C941C5
MDERETRRTGYPLTIPDALLQSDAMQRACAERNFREIFRLVNRRTGSSHAAMAAAIGKMTSTRVSDIIRGVRGIRGQQVIERVADGLGIPGDMLGVPVRPWEGSLEGSDDSGTERATVGDAGEPRSNVLPVTNIPVGPDAARTHCLVNAVGSGEEEDTEVERRRFLGAAAAAATSAVVLPGIAEARQGINAALSGSDAGDLAYLGEAFERHRGGYRGRPPGVVLAEMRGELDLLRDVLNRPHPAAVRADLARTAAGITGLVAIIQHDRGDRRDAHGWFTTAERAACESGDSQMLAWTLARHAMVPLNYGAPKAAAALAVRARNEAGAKPSAAAALAAAVTARALAATGDRQGALRAVIDARSVAERLDGSQTVDTWFGYPEQKHHVHLSQAFTLMGWTREAYTEQAAALALTRSPSVMTRALLTMDAATCLSADGDPSAAADVVVGIWEGVPEEYRSGLIRSRAEALCQTLSGAARGRVRDVLIDL